MKPSDYIQEAIVISESVVLERDLFLPACAASYVLMFLRPTQSNITKSDVLTAFAFAWAVAVAEGN